MEISSEAKVMAQLIWDDYQKTFSELETAKDKRTLLNPEYLNAEFRAMKRMVRILKDVFMVNTDDELKALIDR